MDIIEVPSARDMIAARTGTIGDLRHVDFRWKEAGPMAADRYIADCYVSAHLFQDMDDLLVALGR